jgi:hypothetical protein
VVYAEEEGSSDATAAPIYAIMKNYFLQVFTDAANPKPQLQTRMNATKSSPQNSRFSLQPKYLASYN